MERVPENICKGIYQGKNADCAFRDKLNEIVDWINKSEKPVVPKVVERTQKPMSKRL